jgi:hypothetical protein
VDKILKILDISTHVTPIKGLDIIDEIHRTLKKNTPSI